MRKIIISFCILLAALSLKAQSVSGIRIDGRRYSDSCLFWRKTDVLSYYYLFRCQSETGKLYH